MTARCVKCNRRLKAATPSGMGPVCERAAYGSKQRRRAVPLAHRVDEAQRDFFAEDLDYAKRVDAVLGSISLELA